MASRIRPRRTFALLLGVLVGGVLAPAAAAQQFRANVVSWSPNVLRPGEPATVVLTLRAEPRRSKGRGNGRRDVAVVVRSNGKARRFTTTPLGSGRYRTTIVFPTAAEWALGVQYRADPNSPVSEIPLGKGGACVGDCAASETMRGSPANGNGWLAIALGGAVLLAAVLAAAALRRRMLLRARAGTAAEQAAVPVRPPDR